MIGLTFKAAKGGFFDRPKIQQAVAKAERQVLSKFGAFVRQRAKTSIRQRKGTSPPGQPPYSHVGLLRKFILFAYDRPRRSVVIGPTLTKEGSQAPKLLEYGGQISKTVETTVTRISAAGTLVRSKEKTTRQLHYRARPFMGPAFTAELAQLPKLWRNSIR